MYNNNIKLINQKQETPIDEKNRNGKCAISLLLSFRKFISDYFPFLQSFKADDNQCSQETIV